MTSRRQFLAVCATGAAVSLAGCSRDEVGSLSMSRMDSDRQLGQRATRQIDPDDSPLAARILRESTASGATTVPGDVPPAANRGEDSELEAALENEGETVVADHPRWQPEQPVVWGDSVYEVTREAVGEETRTIYEVRASPADDREPEIGFSVLPAIDREKFHRLPSRAGRDSFTFARRYTGPPAETEESAFVPEPEHEVIDVEGNPVAIETRSTEATVTTFRYETEQLAGSVSGYGSDLRAEYEFVLDGLDGDQRQVVQQAIDGTFTAHRDGEDEEAFRGVVGRFNDEEPVIEGTDDREGEWLAEYEGTTYWAELRLYAAYDY